MQGSTAVAPRLSLVIPAFNEEAGIAKAIAEADDALREFHCPYEIIVVDDGSRDRTTALANETAARRPNVRVIRHDINRGYGAALRTGFEAARGELIAFTDADCQFDLSDLQRLIPLTKTAPIAVGYRVNRQDPWLRRFLSRGYNLLVRGLLGTRVRDVDCALKVFRRDALHHLMPRACNFFINSEMLARARQRGFDVCEVGVRHRPRQHGHSKVSLGDVPRTLRALLPFWWTQVMFPISSRNFSPRGGPWNELYLVVLVVLALIFRFVGVAGVAGGDWLTDSSETWGSLTASGTNFVTVHGAGLLGSLLVLVVGAGWAGAVASRRVALMATLLLGFSPLPRFEAPLALLALAATATMGLLHVALTRTHFGVLFWLAACLCCGVGIWLSGPIVLWMVSPPVGFLLFLDRRLRRPTRAEWILAALSLLGGRSLYLTTGVGTPSFEIGTPSFEIRSMSDGMSPVGVILWVGLTFILIYDLLHHDAWRRRSSEQGVFSSLRSGRGSSGGWPDEAMNGRSCGFRPP